jgi:DNA-3-methyladenine glycosylase I
MQRRCSWAKTELSIPYHDKEWGVPLHNDKKLFEFLILEGHQAGLSWEIILKKRAAYRIAFDAFDPVRVARYDAKKLRALLRNPELIRNKLKMHAAVANARAFLEVRKEFGSFDKFIWQFVGGKPMQNRRRSPLDVPARTAESDAMSKELKRRGFSFVGSTICYAMMQAVGMVNDHWVRCFRHSELSRRNS